MNVKNQSQHSTGTHTENKGKKKEILLLVVIFIVIVLVGLVFYGKTKDAGSEAIVTIDGVEYGRYDLSKEAEIPITIDGVTTNYLLIANEAADMIEADCPDQLCVNMKAISMDGETIVCLPNKVVVEVESDTQVSELDAVVQ
ncbi:MAG: NusG domain II-containing protein [Eubacterium sp.]|nr:NusG domain II-containing protein [Eubacterium sp.]